MSWHFSVTLIVLRLTCERHPWMASKRSLPADRYQARPAVYGYAPDGSFWTTAVLVRGQAFLRSAKRPWCLA